VWFVGFCGFLVVALVIAGVVGCADKSRRLREGEALQYKRELLQSHPHELNPQYVERFLYSPARSKNDINAVFDDFAKKSAEAAAADRAQYSKERSGGSGTPATGNGSAPPPVPSPSRG
jgi:hypothetical protein